jgi:molecular chaperone Hsp33
MREPYSGTVELQSGEIGEDVAYYLARSEQTPSAVGVGVFVVPEGVVDAAGGFLIQLLPGLTDGEIRDVEQEIAELPHPTRLIQDGLSPEEVLTRILGDGVEVLDRYPVLFACPCTRERFEAAIGTLGADEISQIIEEEERDKTEVVCHFCNEAYYFTADQMQQILEGAR